MSCRPSGVLDVLMEDAHLSQAGCSTAESPTGLSMHV